MKKTLIIPPILIIFTFCFGEKTIFGERIFYNYYGSNLINQKLILRHMPKLVLKNRLNNNLEYGEPEEGKIPLWKQAGIYSLEFIGAGVGSAISGIGGFYFSGMPFADADDWNIPLGLGVYVVGNLLITSTCAWGIGKLLTGGDSWYEAASLAGIPVISPWWKAALGAGAGCLIGVSAIAITGEISGLPLGILFVAPPLGAVVAFNIK